MKREETETMIRWDAEDPNVHLWSNNPTVLRRLARLGIVVTGRKGFYLIPRTRFRWGLKRVGVAGQRPPRRRSTVDLPRESAGPAT